MNGKRILITGATGFVGRQVAANLSGEHDLLGVGLGRDYAGSTLPMRLCDLKDPESCRELIRDFRPQTLIHCAWSTEHGQFWEDRQNENWLEAGKVLAEAFYEAGGERFVGIGSCAEYAGAHDYPRDESETDHEMPETIYGRSKLNLQRFLHDLRVDYAWPRIFLTYGPFEDCRRLIPSVACSILDGRAAKCSSGRQLRDFLDVRDLGRAIATLAVSTVKGPINLGSGINRRISEVVGALAGLAGAPNLVDLGALPDRPGEVPVLVPDTSRQEDELHFRPEIGLEQGLGNALDYWRQVTNTQTTRNIGS